MFKSLSTLIFCLLLVLAARYVWHTVPTMPDIVAVHFVADGSANGFTTRDNYLKITLLLNCGLPLFMTLLISTLARVGEGASQRLARGGQAMSPEAQAAKLEFLTAHAARLGCVMLLFLSAVHRLVMQANTLSPPQLDSTALLHTMLALFAGLALWVGMLMRRFGRAR
jgi:uncharacterized membrane protein